MWLSAEKRSWGWVGEVVGEVVGGEREKKQCMRNRRRGKEREESMSMSGQ